MSLEGYINSEAKVISPFTKIDSKYASINLLAKTGFKFRSPSSSVVYTKHTPSISFFVLKSTQSAGTVSPSKIYRISPFLTWLSVIVITLPSSISLRVGILFILRS